MTPTREQAAIAKRIHKRVKDLRRQGGDEVLLGGMHGLMLEFEPLLKAQPGVLDELCESFAEFRYFVRFLEQLASGIQSGAFDDLLDDSDQAEDDEPGAIDIPDTIFNAMMVWMSQERTWPDRLHGVLFEHFHAYCEACDIDDFDQLAQRIGQHHFSVFWGWAFGDFLSRETEDGNVIGSYLRRQGHREKPLHKAYMQAVRQSALSLYEVSDIRPGESMLARDLIRGGEPVRVIERTATRTLPPWEKIAARLVEVRGRWMIAGPIMAFDPDLVDDVIAQIHDRADEARASDDDSGMPSLALETSLKLSAPLFTNLWLLQSLHKEQEPEVPEIFNSDGDPIEFITIHMPLKSGVTQKQVKSLLDDAADMAPADSKCWNWIETEPRSSRHPKPKGQTFVSRMEDGSIALGLLTLQGRKLVIEVNSRDRADQLQERLRAIAGDLLGKAVLSHQTVERALAERRQARGLDDAAPADIPVEVQEEAMRNMFDAHYRETLDQPNGMLDDRSPREAVRSRAGRAKTASWLKHLETMTARQTQAHAMEPYDFAWMWRELGIDELRR